MRQRWSVAVLGLAVVVLFGYVATHRDPVRRPEPPAAVPTTPSGLPRVVGTRAPGPEGLRVLVSGQYPRIIDTSTGHAAPVPGVQLSAGERAAVQIVPAGTVLAETAPGTSRVHTTLVPTAGARRPFVLGDDVVVVPAARGTDLYVAARGPASTKVSVTGATGKVRAAWTAGGRLTPLRDTAAGLVAVGVDDREVTDVRVVDPRTGALRRRLAVGAIVVTVGPSSLAYVQASCPRDCPVTVTRLADGRTRDYRMPAGTGNPGTGAFAPGGRWLALGVPGQYRNGRLVVVPGFAEVLDLATGTVVRVPGLETAAERAPDLSWSGGTLVLGVWSGDGGQVASWSTDRQEELRVLPADPPGDAAFSSVTVLPP
jgi:hypothetical protein